MLHTRLGILSYYLCCLQARDLCRTSTTTWPGIPFMIHDMLPMSAACARMRHYLHLWTHACACSFIMCIASF